MTEHEKVMFQTYAMAKIREEADRLIVQEYARAEDPERLLSRRIYEIIACTANAAIDVAAPQQEPQQTSSNFEWYRENVSRTENRIERDPIFHRLVQSQTHAICEEVSLYRRGMTNPLYRDPAVIPVESRADIEVNPLLTQHRDLFFDGSSLDPDHMRAGYLRHVLAKIWSILADGERALYPDADPEYDTNNMYDLVRKGIEARKNARQAKKAAK